MIAYSLILFAVAGLLLFFGVSIYRGNTKWIHDYHQTNVKASDRSAYGRAFAKGLFVLAAALLLSGGIALLGGGGGVLIAELAVLFGGIVLAVFILWRVEKKYNGGLFG